VIAGSASMHVGSVMVTQTAMMHQMKIIVVSIYSAQFSVI